MLTYADDNVNTTQVITGSTTQTSWCLVNAETIHLGTSLHIDGSRPTRTSEDRLR